MERELIFEELSVSNEVTQETERVYNIIKEEIDNMDYNSDYKVYGFGYTSSIKTILQKKINKEIEPVFNILSQIEVTVSYFINVDDYRKYYDRFDFGGTFYLKDKLLTMNIFAINGVVNEKFFKSILSHEIHHVYQERLISLSTKVRELYQKALYIIGNESGFKNSIHQLANLIYFFDKVEIEANMESLYNELKATQGNVSKVNTLITFNNQRDLYNSYKDYFFDEEFQTYVAEVFGISFKKIMNYLQRMIDYFEVKRNKVLAFYAYERKLNERALKNWRGLYII